ncbi:nuclear transport factor 2 family protein [Jiulongibacter sp. NS-SX5]|uniref:nuclear transport factor 2 family protein n=1 Tax=Jiulongibacter sp. NS-SX5 TaxID=3463854 RepID=UPI004059669F
MKKLILSFVLMAFFAFGTQAQEKNIEASVEQLKELLVNPNKSDLQSICHFKLSYGHSSGRIENRDEFIESLMTKASDFTDIELTNQTIDIIGKTAAVRHELYAKTLDGGKPGEVRLKVLTVWLKQKKGWVLFARQAVR